MSIGQIKAPGRNLKVRSDIDLISHASVVRIITISAGENDNGFKAFVPCICPIVLIFIQSLIRLVGTVASVVVEGSAKMIAATIKKYNPNRG